MTEQLNLTLAQSFSLIKLDKELNFSKLFRNKNANKVAAFKLSILLNIYNDITSLILLQCKLATLGSVWEQTIESVSNCLFS